MKIGIISLMSDVHDAGTINRASGPIIAKLKHSFELEEIKIETIDSVDLPIIFVKTGGTEHKFKQLASALLASGKPLTILSTHTNNSLPASMEILSWANMKGFKNSLLLHGSTETIKKKLEKHISDFEIMGAVKRARIGVIGIPSDWLIASHVDPLEISKRWGTTIVNIDLKPMIENITRFSESAAMEILSSFPEPVSKESIRRKAFVDAVKIYLGLKRTISEYRLTALTIRCFDLLSTLNNTGCLALARLNDEGIPAGCEGDIPALFTMMINRLITGTPAFMANPSRIQDRRVTLAHCTVPMCMVESFSYKTHFESDKGVAIAGNFKKDHVTLSKIGGPLLDQFYAAEGMIIDSPVSKQLCRTQVTVKMNDKVDYFLTNPLGNHHVMTHGCHAARFNELMSFFGVFPVKGSSPF